MANTFRGYAQVAGVSGSFTVPANFAPLKEGMDMTHEFDEDIIKVFSHYKKKHVKKALEELR